LAVGPAGILPAGKSLAGGQWRDEILWASWATKFRQLSDEGIYYADKRTLLSLTQHVRTLDSLRVQLRAWFSKASRMWLPSAHGLSNSCQPPC